MTESSKIVEKRVKEAWKNAQITPREHQWKTCATVVDDITSPHPSGNNYLIQHAAGSGKSLTIACLVVQLYNLKVCIKKNIYTNTMEFEL
jgi:type I restriction enzyme R subunit